MRLRKPKLEPPPFDPSKASPASCLEKPFAVEVVTPIYGGGVTAGHPDTEMPIRASAIRGQLRFWWRLLNRTRHGGDSRALYRAEREIWGGLGTEELGSASRVTLRVTGTGHPSSKPCARYQEKEGRLKGPYWDESGLPGYVLFPGKGDLNESGTGFQEGKKPAEVILPPLTFNLCIGIRSPSGTGIEANQELWETEVLPALRWWASFGGIGARTRRGLGSIKVETLAAVTSTEASAIGCELAERARSGDAVTAWREAVGKLQFFRQGKDLGRNPGKGNVPGPSRWPEADSIREITGHHAAKHVPRHPARIAFPRACFGLPIITHFKPEPGEPTDTALVPVWHDHVKERMGSPLILKARWDGQAYRPIALLLPHPELAAMELQLQDLKTRQPNLPRDFPHPTWWSQASRQAMVAGATTNPLQGKSGDVLRDFLDYFGGDDA